MYPTGGDIYALDPLTGKTTALVTGDSNDLDALFSPDGTRVAFDRLSSGQNPVTTTIMVADADGQHPKAVTDTPLLADGERFEWAPDSRSLFVKTQDRQILLIDATRPGTPRVLATNVDDLYTAAARPPDGKQLLIRRGLSFPRLVLLDVVTGVERMIAQGGPDDLGAARWSPDGSHVVYHASAPGDPDSQRLWMVSADGTGARQLTHAPGTWADVDPTWSPDGKRIAFNRFEHSGENPDGSWIWEVRQIGVYDVATDTVKYVGPLSRDVRTQHPTDHDLYPKKDEKFGIEWAPDGKSLLAVPTEATGHPVLIDSSTGAYQVLDTLFDEQGGASQEWQRTAP